MRGVVLGFVSASLLLTFVPITSVAQDAAPGGALYMTPTVVAGGACQGAPVSSNYAMTEAKPAAAGKAYTAISGGGVSCGFSFKYTATSDSVLKDEIKIFLQVGCDIAGQAIELDYTFQVGSSTVATLRPSVSYQCTSASTVFPYTQTFDGKNTKIKTGDVVTLTLNLFAAVEGAPNTAGNNWHIKTGNPTTPSGVFGVGLPGGAPAGSAVVAEVLSLSGPTENQTGQAGSSFSIPIGISNDGSADANFTANATGAPEGFAVAVDPATGSVAAGATANVTANVSIPSDAAPGAYNFTVTVAGPNGGNASLVVNFSVEAAAPGGSGNATTNSTANATTDAAGAPKEAGGIPGPSAPLTAIAVAASGFLALRRRK